MNYYETNLDDASKFFDSDIRAVLRVLRTRGNPKGKGLPAATANVTADKGWFGGIEKPPAEWRDIPVENIVLEEEMFEELATAMEKTGFWSGDAWYANHKRNRAYTLEKRKNDGVLEMPVLFVHAKQDHIVETEANPKGCENMRRQCKNLKEAVVDASHWVAEEKPLEVNAAIARWLVEECPQVWPKSWVNL